MPLAELTLTDDVARVTLNRPDKRNALNEPLLRELLDRLDEAKDARPRGLLLTGEGPTFCAGGDILWMKERSDDPKATRQVLTELHGPLIETVHTFPAPTVSAVQGAAVGAGLGLALACDLTFVTPDAVLGATHTRLGLTPDGGTSWYLTRSLGPKRALDLLLGARTFTGQDAVDWGLVSQAVHGDELETVAKKRVRTLADGPTQAYHTTRQLVRDAAETPLREMLEREAEAQAAMYRTEDQTEGVTAFLEDRDPEFQGR